MADPLTAQIRQLAFAIVTGGHRLTGAQADALADLNAAAALVARGSGPLASLVAMRYASGVAAETPPENEIA